MPCNHIGFYISQHFKCNNGVQENGRLGNICLLKVFVRTAEHDIGNTKASYFICLLK